MENTFREIISSRLFLKSLIEITIEESDYNMLEDILKMGSQYNFDKEVYLNFYNGLLLDDILNIYYNANSEDRKSFLFSIVKLFRHLPEEALNLTFERLELAELCSNMSEEEINDLLIVFPQDTINTLKNSLSIIDKDQVIEKISFIEDKKTNRK